LANPHQKSDKADRVKGMFSAIAPSYDLNNRLHSFGRDQAWRKKAVQLAQVQPGDTVLDIACGTGDLTEQFAQTAASRVIGIDFTPAMLEIAREKVKPRPHSAKVEYREGDAMNLAVADASADVVSIAFGIRNVAQPARAFAEFFRVLKPGGRLVVLEFDRPRTPPMSWGYDLYCGWIMPRTATLISGDKSGAYKYLPASVDSFFTRDQMQQELRNARFSDVKERSLTFGICVCYRAIKSQ
jgi:demethylmenaquinone methyltransferase/2-methoxy-6-polyprenyl-1,4-benzoquinol methylase